LIAQVRSTTLDRLSRSLSGDIDAIVLKALRKEPKHRYGSVEQLAADIIRFLSHDVVQARQGNWLYYSRRFARRHALGVTAGSAFLVFVISVAVVMSIQRQEIANALERATQQGQRAETVSEFMLDVFKAADPYIHFGKEPTARNLLEEASRRIHSDLSQQPTVRARLLEAIGRSFNRMGQPDRALPLLEESVEIQRQLHVNDSRMGSLLAELAIVQRELAKLEESDRSLSQALAILTTSDAPHTESQAQLLLDLGRLEMARSNTDQAQRHLQSALQLMNDLRGANDPEVGSVLLDLANVFVWKNDLEEAERIARRAADIYTRVPSEHPDRIVAESLLAQILLYRNEASAASPLFERVLAAQRLVYGSSNGPVADTLSYLAQVRVAENDYDAAEALMREALAIHKNAGSSESHRIGYLQTLLASVLLRRGESVQAEGLLRDTLDLFARTLPPDHQYVASAEYYLGEALLGNRKLSDAEAVLMASVNRWKRSDAPTWRAARSRNTLGEVLAQQGRETEGEHHLVMTFQELSTDPGADKEAIDRARDRLSKFYVDRGQRAKFDLLMQEQSARVAGHR
jgi:tetratricopeptide (TPR) repeat protein